MALSPVPVRAQSPIIRVGVLNDMSGPYRDAGGPTAVACVRQALEDFGVSTKRMDVEVLSADHQNKPDIGAGISRQGIDRDGGDWIAHVPNSGVARAVQQVVREKNKVYLNSSNGTDRLTGDLCSPNMLQWPGDTYMQARSTGGALVAAGARTWYILVADYALGHQRETPALRSGHRDERRELPPPRRNHAPARQRRPAPRHQQRQQRHAGGGRHSIVTQCATRTLVARQQPPHPRSAQ